ncbi:helix-turn-helix domain-containing protein [Phenylobacterium sp.]|jgi:AcrR family transcriptional regulator|uniref:TetR/AcrR family transcriptional regulator n=1 Tax=Phenylobacterium sp. TaxID=1871053 RepID=UPI002E32AD88|nr:helix-turn-helix domain-containing protein [Phenylobacterium sp.]HEX4713095.1 helix-turn-helix domain-containing protein [Phenylobacterium sp.]
MADSQEKPRRGDKRERTRAALISAAWAVVEEKGFAAASLEEIARRAGMTRGAIYSNFPSRSDLLLAMVGTRGLSINRDFSRPGTLKEQLRWFAEGLIETLPNAPGTQRWHAEFMVHIAADPALREHIAGGFANMFDEMAAQFRAQHGETLAIDAHSLALAVQSLAMGFVYQCILSPDAVPARAVIEAFDALATGAIREPA